MMRQCQQPVLGSGIGHTARGVLKIRNGVEGLVPRALFQTAFQLIKVRALHGKRDAFDASAGKSEYPLRLGEHWILQKDDVTGVDKRLRTQEYPLHGAVGHHHILRSDVPQIGDMLSQTVNPRKIRVVERCEGSRSGQHAFTGLQGLLVWEHGGIRNTGGVVDNRALRRGTVTVMLLLCEYTTTRHRGETS